MAAMLCGLHAWGTTPSGSAITTFDAPDAYATALRGTAALAIDAAGDVAGVYSDANNLIHSYVRSAGGTITEFDAPSLNGTPNQATIPIGFDAAGDLAGIYVDATGRTHGFFRTASGTFIPIDAPGAGIAGNGTSGDTIPTFIDAAGDIAGVYVDSNQVTHGFLLPAGGSITTFEAANLAPGTGGTSPGTDYVTVNATGGVAGTYVDTNNVIHGFVRSSDGTITSIDAAAAGTSAGQGTAVSAIDSTGRVGGVYVDSNNVAHGFVRSANGSFSYFDSPQVGSGPGQSPGIFPFSYPFQFDAAGDLAGVYLDANYVVYGFVRSPSGTITTFTAPDAAPMPTSLKRSIARLSRNTKVGAKVHSFAQRRVPFLGGMSGARAHRYTLADAISVNGTQLTEIDGTAGLAINATGTIAGVYTDSEAGMHSFLRTPSGAITEFNVPAAGDGVYQGTVAFAINDNGTVAGTYLDSNSELHGFVATLGQVATTTSLTVQPGSAVYGQPVTLTAQVVSGSSAPPDGETVQFLAGATVLGSAPTSKGTATFTTTELPVGMGSLTAAYTGDTTYAGSTSNASIVPVSTATTFTSLTSAPNPSTIGQAVTFTARVTGEYGGTATGTMTFSNGSTALGSAPVSGDSATFSTSSLGAGTYLVTATYAGDLNFQSSTSAPVNQSVTATPVYSMTATSTTVAPGSSATSIVTVSSTSSYTGTITLSCMLTSSPAGATNLPTCLGNPTVILSSSATNGVATFTVNTTAATSAMVLPQPKSGRPWTGAGGGAVLAVLILLWVPKGRRNWRSLLGIALAVTVLSGITACSGGGGPIGKGSGSGTSVTNPGTTAGNYTFTVSGVGNDSAKTTATTTFTLTVN